VENGNLPIPAHKRISKKWEDDDVRKPSCLKHVFYSWKLALSLRK